jgi:large subunit ribosomal protein L17
MRHLKSGRKLNRTSSHRKALLRTLATSLFEHKKIATTEAKAKELRPYAERLITKAKHALLREKQGLLPEGQTLDIHNRRIVYRDIRNKAVLEELFDTIAPMVEDRPGGYTRITKTGFRRGDGGRTAIIELVDWSAPQDGAVALKGKKRTAQKKEKTVKEQIVEDFEDDIEDTVAVEEATEETPVEDMKAEEPAEEAPVEDAKAEEPSEEAPVEEPKAEEPTEEAPVEEPKSQEPTEEAPVEEPKDEAPVEETKADEPSSETSEEPKTESSEDKTEEEKKDQ